MSRRTAFRDIEALRATGVPGAFDEERDRYSFPGTQFLPPINFTPAEAMSLVALANEQGSYGVAIDYGEVGLRPTERVVSTGWVWDHVPESEGLSD